MINSRKISWRERIDTPLAKHYAGLAAILLLVVGLTVQLGLDLAATSNSFSNALDGKQLELRVKELEAAPLRDLDKRLKDSRAQIRSFYSKRIPFSYSVIASRIGELQVNSGVRFARVLYSQGKPGVDLTEISVDAGITGSYPQVMHFVNSLECDQNYFVIRSMQLTGQQGGQVNLRILASTWLLPTDAAASGLPLTPNAVTGSAHIAGKEGE
jgi:Tfp pilus assembly protein PilO